jgi:hypothetical protein
LPFGVRVGTSGKLNGLTFAAPCGDDYEICGALSQLVVVIGKAQHDGNRRAAEIASMLGGR